MPLVSSLPPRFSKEEVKGFIAGFYNLTVTVKHLVSDIGKVIGKRGQNISAIRTLLSTASKGQHRTTLQIGGDRLLEE